MTEYGIDQYFDLLKQLLGQEIVLLKKIKAVEDEKYHLLTTKKFIDLTPQNELLEKLLKEEILLEQRREALVKELNQYYQSDSLTLNELIPILPEKDSKDFNNIQSQFKQLTGEIKQVNETNKIIIDDMLKIIGYTLDSFIEEKTLETNYGDRNAHKQGYKSVLINAVI